MRHCPTCSAPVAADLSTCPSCAAPLEGLRNAPADDATIIAPRDAASRTSASSPSGSGDRFVPGTVIRERYRVVGLLGRGGMGEVYRADDLKLGHSVALKFLPREFAADADRLARFYDEVRTARQVSHANVCRVHDIDEFDGQPFLSMEYVDGEDLSSLLRRIGRMPEERAVEVARQICAGLAAVHEEGVLHRDLKPANVMIDGRGRVRLTDFGLASLAHETGDEDVRAGTPAYMSPEQLTGRGISARSDIYALGLVLYELFTGHRVFDGDTIAEITSMHTSSVPSSLSQYVNTLDPVVEAVVLRCLEKDPAHRPTSAFEVAAALPGGDPLAAALAAGETPSPELVAEAGAREALHPLAAIGLAVLGLALFVGASHWAATMSWHAFLPFEKQPEVLHDRALDLIATLGYEEEIYTDPVDTAWGWLVWNDVIRTVADQDSSSERWRSLRERPDVGGYWYRQAPTPMYAAGSLNGPIFVRGRVSLTDPPPLGAGEIVVLLDLDGSLRRFEAPPIRFGPISSVEPDWGPLFRAAGVDTSRLRPTEPLYQRFFDSDIRRAWLVTFAQQPDVEYRIEAGARGGRPVLFNVASSASLESLREAPTPFHPSLGRRVLESGPGLLILVLVGFVVVLQVRNIQERRADTRGATRFAGAMFLLFLVSQALDAHALGSFTWMGELWGLIGAATFVGLIAWATYSAAEPVGRRVWPTMFISSSRLLGRSAVVWRDALIGRSVLAGIASGSAIYLLTAPVWRFVSTIGESAPSWPFGINLGLVMGGKYAVAQVIDVASVIGITFLDVAILVVLQRWVKRRWLAVLLTVLVWSVMDGVNSLPDFGRELFFASLSIAVLLRFGVVALLVSMVIQALCWDARAIDYGHWSSEGALIAWVAVVLLAAYGVWAATSTNSLVERRGTSGG